MIKQVDFPLDLSHRVYGMNFEEWHEYRIGLEKKIERLEKANRFHVHDVAIKVLVIMRTGAIEMENRALLASLSDNLKK